ncbi:hypothetical protein BDZ91DRAFT_853127 [Kalaharituber pfeilii]|nr:hypothetical protein BDZ91DRAFT_853127 [Kalaharituber pfeilii]
MATDHDYVSVHMSVLPPGNTTDLTDANKTIWSDKFIGKWIDEEIKGGLPGPCGTNRGELPQFFNGTVTPYNVKSNGTLISWIGFPNLLNVQYQSSEPVRWQMADASRLVQDEYLEWTVDRDKNGKIISVKFTCEGPEYWQFLGDAQPETTLALYRTLNPEYAEQISLDDLYLTNAATGTKTYNPMNYWNKSTTRGTIAHLVQPNNTLSAEIDIAAQATVIRQKRGTIIVDADALIKCSKYGNPARNSDPTIGNNINTLARDGSHLTIKDPVGIYIRSFDLRNLKLAMDSKQKEMISLSDTDDIVTFPRGALPKRSTDYPGAMRIHISVPRTEKYKSKDPGVDRYLTVSDIWDTSKRTYIEYGAQFADYIMMGVTGVANSGDAAKAQNCPCAKGPQEREMMLMAWNGVIRDENEVEEHRLPQYNFRVR